MTRPVNRVLALLELLQSQPRISGADLARRLEVDRRTIRRYIATLEDLGFPILAERGRDGGYALVQGFKLPPMIFTSDEALALSIGLRAARQLGLRDIAPAARSAQAKLERVMPEPTRRRVQAVEQTVTLDLSRFDGVETPRFLVDLADASRRRQRLRLRYRTPGDRETERNVDVYAVACRGGHWYAVGHCHLRRDLRSFRLDRIRSVAAVAEIFERPNEFDVLEYLAHSIARLPRAHEIAVVLRTDIQTARRAIFGDIATLELQGDAVLLRAQADDLSWFARELARMPFPFEILQPPALRELLAAHGRALIAQCAQRPAPD